MNIQYNNGLIPLLDGVIYNDGKFYEINVTEVSRNNYRFDKKAMCKIDFQKIEWCNFLPIDETTIEGKQIFLQSGGGHYGGAGFLAMKQKNILFWILHFTIDSNPLQIIDINDLNIIVKSDFENFVFSVPLFKPEELKFI